MQRQRLAKGLGATSSGENAFWSHGEAEQIGRKSMYCGICPRIIDVPLLTLLGMINKRPFYGDG
jgi:hypothetical protein